MGVFPIDTFLWAFSVTYLTIAFYEYIFDEDKVKTKFSKNIKYLVYILSAILIIFGIIYSVNDGIIIIKYFYIYFALGFFIIPPTIIIWKYPKIMKKVIYQGLFFFVLSILYELTAIHAGHWIFPGDYIGFVEILGLRFPIEELLWLMLCVPSTIAIYEFFVDDRK